MIPQLPGAVGAGQLLHASFGAVSANDASVPGTGVSSWPAFLVEVVLATGLANTILVNAFGARNTGTNGAIAVGAYISPTGLWVVSISGHRRI